MCDAGIEFGLATGLTARLKELTRTSAYSDSSNRKLHQLALSALGNIAMNQVGKQ